jgi:hypothetical protein
MRPDPALALRTLQNGRAEVLTTPTQRVAITIES